MGSKYTILRHFAQHFLCLWSKNGYPILLPKISQNSLTFVTPIAADWPPTLSISNYALTADYFT
jgi:hypothetical protein